MFSECFAISIVLRCFFQSILEIHSGFIVSRLRKEKILRNIFYNSRLFSFFFSKIDRQNLESFRIEPQSISECNIIFQASRFRPQI